MPIEIDVRGNKLTIDDMVAYIIEVAVYDAFTCETNFVFINKDQARIIISHLQKQIGDE